MHSDFQKGYANRMETHKVEAVLKQHQKRMEGIELYLLG